MTVDYLKDQRPIEGWLLVHRSRRRSFVVDASEEFEDDVTMVGWGCCPADMGLYQNPPAEGLWRFDGRAHVTEDDVEYRGKYTLIRG